MARQAGLLDQTIELLQAQKMLDWTSLTTVQRTTFTNSWVDEMTTLGLRS